MKYNFDEVIERRGTDSVKWDGVENVWGRKDLLPMWVADMDFRTPPFVMDALRRRLDHEVLGYTFACEEWYTSICSWLHKRHQWDVTRDMLTFVPGIVRGQAFALQCFTKPGDKAFCSGGDQNVKGRGGYIGKDGVPRLSVLDVQKQIRSIPKPVIAAVNGFAIGGGHVLHVVCDLSIASENAIFGQTGPRVGSFDAGFGASYLARVVGQKKAREIWFLCRKYNAQEALEMGLVNKVVPLEQLEDEYVQWAEEMMQLSPLALRMIKAGLNAELDGQSGIQELAGDATLLYYLTDEAQEGKNAFLEKRKPNFKQYPKFP